MARRLLKIYPSQEAQKKAALSDKTRREADYLRVGIPWDVRKEQLACVVGDDAELVAVTARLKHYSAAQKQEPPGRGRPTKFDFLYEASALLLEVTPLFGKRGVKLKLGYSSQATKLLQGDLDGELQRCVIDVANEPKRELQKRLKSLGLRDARDVAQRLRNVSDRMGAR